MSEAITDAANVCFIEDRAITVHNSTMLAVALAVRFALELCLISVTAWFFYRLSPGWNGAVLSLGGVIILAATWGTLLSPRRTVELGALVRLALELALFGLAAAALYSGGHWKLAALLIAVEVIDKSVVTFLQRASS
jgi:hypothetical protein